MTVNELYTYACSNNLQDVDVYEVINTFKVSSNYISTRSASVLPFELGKVEYSYEDTMNLFST